MSEATIGAAAAHEQPDLAHASRRIEFSLQSNTKTNQMASYQLQLRPALHDLTSRPHGFSKDLQIEFLTLDLLLKNKKLDLKSLDIIKILSVPRYSRLLNTVSWTLNLGAQRDGALRNKHIWGGAGLAHDFSIFKAFTLGIADIGHVGRAYAGAGAYGGLLVAMGTDFRLWADAKYVHRLGAISTILWQWNALFVYSATDTLELTTGVSTGVPRLSLRLYL